VVHSVWRLASETPSYASDDLSGKGAEITGGRWNNKGTPLIYTSGSIALACLETVVHLGGSFALPLNRYLIRIDIPGSAWRERTLFDAGTRVGWDAVPAGLVSISWGTQWAKSGAALVAEVPSIVVPEEQNLLLNPGHPEATKLTAQKIRRWIYDARFI
jgi:RES domain-containing protein